MGLTYDFGSYVSFCPRCDWWFVVLRWCFCVLSVACVLCLYVWFAQFLFWSTVVRFPVGLLF